MNILFRSIKRPNASVEGHFGKTFRRWLWVAAPLLTVAIYAAPEWPARVAMTAPAWRDRLYPMAQSWAQNVAAMESVEKRESSAQFVASVTTHSSSEENMAGLTTSTANRDATADKTGLVVKRAAKGEKISQESTISDAQQKETASRQMGPDTERPPLASFSGGASSEASQKLNIQSHGSPIVRQAQLLEEQTQALSQEHVATESSTHGSDNHGSGSNPNPNSDASPNTVKSNTDQGSGPQGTLLTIGDSLMEYVAAGLKRGLPSTLRVQDAHKVSTGLTNVAYYDWPGQAQARAASVHPSWVVFHLGGNDAQDMLIHKRWVRFGSDEWRAEYLARAEKLIDNIRAVDPEVKMVWIGLPAMRDPSFAQKMEVIRQVQEQASEARAVPYIDESTALGATYQKEGVFEGRRRVWRADDGIHYSPEGAWILARTAAKDQRLGWDWSDDKKG